MMSASTRVLLGSLFVVFHVALLQFRPHLAEESERNQGSLTASGEGINFRVEFIFPHESCFELSRSVGIHFGPHSIKNLTPGGKSLLYPHFSARYSTLVMTWLLESALSRSLIRCGAEKNARRIVDTSRLSLRSQLRLLQEAQSPGIGSAAKKTSFR